MWIKQFLGKIQYVALSSSFNLIVVVGLRWGQSTDRTDRTGKTWWHTEPTVALAPITDQVDVIGAFLCFLLLFVCLLFKCELGNILLF